MADSNDQQQQDGQAPSGERQEEAGFGAAFAERATDPAGRASKTQEDGDEPSDKEPADKAGSEQAPAKEAATAQTTSGTGEEADPLAELTPEQLRQRLRETEAERDKARASDRSNRGRVGALTKKLQTLSSGTPAPSPAPTQEKKEGQASGTGEGAETAADLDKKLQAVADEYGDVVGPIVQVVQEVRAKIENFEKSATTKAEVDADAEELTEALTALERVHPDYAAIAEDQNFTAWLGDQSPKTIELANSFDPREVSLVLTLYKAERSAATAKPSGEGDDKGKQEGAATDDRRKRQLEGNRQVHGKSQPAAAGVPNDFKSAFKARAEAHT